MPNQSGLILWHDAALVTQAGGFASSWTDRKSALHAVQPGGIYQPAWSATAQGGKPGITFDDNNDAFASPYSVLLGAKTVAISLKLKTVPSGYDPRWIYILTGPSNAAMLMIVNGGTAAQTGFNFFADTPNAGVCVKPYLVSMDTSTVHRFVVTYLGGTATVASNWRIVYQGNPCDVIANGTGSGGSTSYSSSIGGLVVTSTGLPATNGSRNHTEFGFRLWNRALTLAETLTEDENLQLLTASTASWTPILVMDGNSLVQGAGSSEAPQTFMQAKLGGIGTYGVANVAVSGQTTPQVTARYAATGALFNGRRPKNTLYMFEGTNDLLLNAPTARQLVDNIWAYFAGAAGWQRKITGTVIDRVQFNSAQRALVATANGLMRAEAATQGVVLLDYAADSRLNTYSDPTYFYDGIHWNDAGQDIATTMLATAVLA